ncbi:MAG: hypothetical protein ACRDWT_14415 [Jatrophihabitantaceae bacterium]
MSGFDAELYLRLCGENALLSGENGAPWDDPLLERARALLAVDAVPDATARRVITDYQRARALRGMGHYERSTPRSTPVTPLAPRRIVRCGHTFDQPPGQLELRYASLGADETRLAVTMRMDAAPRRSRHGPRPHRGGPNSVQVVDDQGTSAMLHFSGGGSDSEWTGYYTASQPLAPGTRWLELLGERVELVDEQFDGTVEVETFGDTDAAERYLWHQLSSSGSPHHHGSVSLDAAVDALVACGALAPTSPTIDEALTVADALQNFFGGQAPVGPALPEPWRSLIARRGLGGGPRGSLLIGVVTPVFDGVSAALAELRSSGDAYELDVQIAGAGMDGPFHAGLERSRIAFSGKDDRGNAYLGGLGSFGGGDDSMEGQVEFWPALDPLANRLDLALTTDRARAVVTIPLHWHMAPDDGGDA